MAAVHKVPVLGLATVSPSKVLVSFCLCRSYRGKYGKGTAGPLEGQRTHHGLGCPLRPFPASLWGVRGGRDVIIVVVYYYY